MSTKKAKKPRSKTYAPKLQTNRSFKDLIKMSVTGKLVQSNTKDKK
jgi:hypothetical protein